MVSGNERGRDGGMGGWESEKRRGQGSVDREVMCWESSKDTENFFGRE